MADLSVELTGLGERVTPCLAVMFSIHPESWPFSPWRCFYWPKTGEKDQPGGGGSVLLPPVAPDV